MNRIILSVGSVSNASSASTRSIVPNYILTMPSILRELSTVHFDHLRPVWIIPRPIVRLKILPDSPTSAGFGSSYFRWRQLRVL